MMNDYCLSIEDPYPQHRNSLAVLADTYEPGLVSVIIPCYNSEDYVTETVNSALNQTYEHVEVIVVDDGSTDGSQGLLRKFGDRIRLRIKANAGAPAARNDGLEMARGEFIQFLDADDILIPDAVERRLGAMHPNDGAVFGDIQAIDEQGCRKQCLSIPPPKSVIDNVVPFLRHNIHTPLPLHRRERIYQVGGFAEGMPSCQEYNLHVRLALAGHIFRHLPGMTTLQRLHNTGSRISNYPWYRREPDRAIRVFHSILSQCQTVPELDNEVCHELADGLWYHGALIGLRGRPVWGLAYWREALRICPGFFPLRKTIWAVSRIVLVKIRSKSRRILDR